MARVGFFESHLVIPCQNMVANALTFTWEEMGLHNVIQITLLCILTNSAAFRVTSDVNFAGTLQVLWQIPRNESAKIR